MTIQTAVCTLIVAIASVAARDPFPCCRRILAIGGLLNQTARATSHVFGFQRFGLFVPHGHCDLVWRPKLDANSLDRLL